MSTVNHQIAAQGAAFSGYYETARTHLLDLLEGGHPPERVLEIGCGGGANLAELKRRFPGVHTTGVELHPAAARVAREAGRADELRTGDVLDRDAVAFTGASFDLIVLSHVLEHFADPSAVIDRALGWLEPDGRLLVALPNIRHASVLFELLFRSDFRYRPAGILDHTHLRFYTRKSAMRWFDEIGLRTLRSAADVDGGKSRLLLWCSLGLARDLAAYAHNFLLRRK